jgi:hypothetical protein
MNFIALCTHAVCCEEDKRSINKEQFIINYSLGNLVV